MAFISINEARNDEYEYQYYSTYVNSIFDCVFRGVKHKIKKHCEELQKCLVNSATDEESRNKATKINKVLRTLYYENLTPHMMQIRKKIKDWLKIPDDILGPDDEKQSIESDDCNLQFLVAERTRLKQKLRSEHVLQAALKFELDCLNDASKVYDEKTLENVKGHLNYRSLVVDELKNLLKKLDEFKQKADLNIQKRTILNPEIDPDDLDDL